tara:strand:+ start:550 stop:1716 length:1167 start_codon:yes stop_codon:yes gene_type:complete
MGSAAAANFQNKGFFGRGSNNGFKSYGSGRAGFNQPGFANQMQGGFMGQSMGAGNPGGTIQQPMFYQPAPASQIGTGAPVANTGQSFVQGSLNSKKGDANYDAFSDFNNDGMVTTLDFAEYNKANPDGQASMIESDQSITNRNNQRQQMMDARSSLMNQLRQMDEGLGMSGMGYGMSQPQMPPWMRGRLKEMSQGASLNPYGNMYGGGLGYGGYFGGYKDGGLIKGYQDGGEMMDPRLEEVSMMEEESIQTPSGTDTEMLRIVLEAKAALEGHHPNPEDAVEKFVEVFGEEELMSLQDHVIRSIETGVDEFQSDGMSDSIPGNIDGMEQVALSEGEYVVPADVVSGIGNGDTGSGARRMREMIETVRMARNGSPQQPPAVDPSMMMPV